MSADDTKKDTKKAAAKDEKPDEEGIFYYKEEEVKSTELYPVYVWQFPVRFYHILNIILVLILGGLGLIMYNKIYLGITSQVAEITLKKVHVSFGYCFMFNNYFRVIWGFIGNSYCRVLNNIPNPVTSFKYFKQLRKGDADQYAGHSPFSKWSTVGMFVCFFTLGGTGYFRAAADLYWPPLGPFVQDYLAERGFRGYKLEAYNMTGVDPKAYEELAWAKGWVTYFHRCTAVLLFSIIAGHVIGAVHHENTQGGTIVTAMITGTKNLPKLPVDLPNAPAKPTHDAYGGLIEDEDETDADGHAKTE